jgi:hypothetical protein
MDSIRALYCNNNGRPTKELRAVTGAIILQHLFDYTDEEACGAYLCDNRWIESLNLDGQRRSDRTISPKTLWDHTKKLSKSGLLKTILDAVNQNLAKVVSLKTQRQRLDSVQVCGNMAKLTRIELFAKTTKGFLANLKKSHRDDFESVDADLRTRHLSDDKRVEGSSYNFFFSEAKPGQRHKTLKSAASDMHTLLEMFKDRRDIAAMQSFKLLRRLFSEQCVVREVQCPEDSRGPVEVDVKEPKEIPGDSLQNPSDPTAAYSGHKGQGYHVQIMETCDETTEVEAKTVNLITVATVEGANVHDGKATLPSIAAAAEAGFKPETLLCDTAYGADFTVEKAKEEGVEVISPAGGKDPEAGKLRLADFNFDGEGRMTSCPEGRRPWAVRVTNGGREACGFDKKACENCPKVHMCPVTLNGDKAQLSFTRKDLRLSKRRARERTEEFKKAYAMRSGIEATNSRLARETGLKKLRYRGLTRIQAAVTFKVIGLNFKRVVAALRSKKVK